jgi:DNA-binding LytR/AlgR family response regulator
MGKPMDKPVKILRCVVVDDEPLAREVLSRFIARVPSLLLVAECENAVQAMSVVQQQEVDLAFVDIQMPEVSGTEFIKILRHPPKIVLTTAFPEYALESYELDAVDYLLKPIQFERFLKAINKVASQIGVTTQPAPVVPDRQEERSDAYLYFRTDRKMVKVQLDEIFYVEGDEELRQDLYAQWNRYHEKFDGGNRGHASRKGVRSYSSFVHCVQVKNKVIYRGTDRDR